MKWDREEIGKFLGSIGAAMLVAGYLRYSIQSELLLMSKILLIAGGVICAGRDRARIRRHRGAFFRSALPSWARIPPF